MTEEAIDRYLQKMKGIIKAGNHWERIHALASRIVARLPKLEELAEELEDAGEEGIYRYYHGSFKVFNLQDPVKEAFALIKEIGGEDDPPSFEYAAIVEAGTAYDFKLEMNDNWEASTKPILEAFWHTQYFVKMMIKYAKGMETIEKGEPFESGAAAVLYLFELR
jgi:hypothetical protein